MRNYKKYKVWELSHEVTLGVYHISQSFPENETFGIKGQMRKAAYSIPSNIAEGCGRESYSDFRKFLSISQGCVSELEYFMILAKDLKYIDEVTYTDIMNQINKVKKCLHHLIKKL